MSETEQLDRALNNLVHDPVEQLQQALDAADRKVGALLKNIAAVLRNVGDSANCKGCGVAIWWLMHKNRKRACYDGDGTNHFATCSKAVQFRKPKT